MRGAPATGRASAQVYARKRFQGLGCSFAQLFRPNFQLAGSEDSLSTGPFRFGRRPRPKPPKTKRMFREAKRNVSHPDLSRWNHYRRRINDFAGLFVFNHLTAVSFRAVREAPPPNSEALTPALSQVGEEAFGAVPLIRRALPPPSPRGSRATPRGCHWT